MPSTLCWTTIQHPIKAVNPLFVTLSEVLNCMVQDAVEWVCPRIQIISAASPTFAKALPNSFTLLPF